ncbi:hypothetical protein ABH915_002245 [Arthrobacter sp. MW3 TE3886]
MPSHEIFIGWNTIVVSVTGDEEGTKTNDGTRGYPFPR